MTSDAKPWPAGGRLGFCRKCGAAVKPADAAWKKECRKIYADYTMYEAGRGAEARAFVGGMPLPRSRRLLDRLLERHPLAPAGRLLDVGSGNGALLRSFAAMRPGWTLEACERGSRFRAEVLRLPGVKAFHVKDAWKAPGRFDAITMLHVLEHVAGPVAYLKRLKTKLAPGGLLFVETPNASRNPFDLLIADHAAHFSAGSLRWTLEAAGYEVLTLAEDWLPKELSAVARVREARAVPSPPAPWDAPAAVAWLKRTLAAARLASKNAEGSFGLFGSSIAAVWLYSALEGEPEFFVDEDSSRWGAVFLGRPIRAPRQVPAGATVFMALPRAIALSVAARMPFRCVLPPEAA